MFKQNQTYILTILSCLWNINTSASVAFLQDLQAPLHNGFFYITHCFQPCFRGWMTLLRHRLGTTWRACNSSDLFNRPLSDCTSSSTPPQVLKLPCRLMTTPRHISMEQQETIGDLRKKMAQLEPCEKGNERLFIFGKEAQNDLTPILPIYKIITERALSQDKLYLEIVDLNWLSLFTEDLLKPFSHDERQILTWLESDASSNQIPSDEVRELLSKILHFWEQREIVSQEIRWKETSYKKISITHLTIKRQEILSEATEKSFGEIYLEYPSKTRSTNTIVFLDKLFFTLNDAGFCLEPDQFGVKITVRINGQVLQTRSPFCTAPSLSWYILAKVLAQVEQDRAIAA